MWFRGSLRSHLNHRLGGANQLSLPSIRMVMANKKMRVLGILATLSMALTLAGCGEERPSRGQAGDDPVLPVGEPTYDVDAPSWAVGDTIHVGDQKITVKPAPEAYVVATGGIYYVTEGTLYFTDGGPVEEVAPSAYSTPSAYSGASASSFLVESDDGRYLGMVVEAKGFEDEFGTAPLVPVVFDLETGTEVLRAEPGPVSKGDDLADLYEEVGVHFLGFDDEAAYVDDPLRDGETRFPLGGGKPVTVPVDDFGFAELPTFVGEGGIEVLAHFADGGGYEISETGDGYAGVLSPDERYLFVRGDDDGAVFYDAASGEQVRFDPGSRNFLLGGWVDDETFYGATDARGPRVRIVSCSTTTRMCTSASRGFRLPSIASLLFGTGVEAYVP